MRTNPSHPRIGRLALLLALAACSRSPEPAAPGAAPPPPPAPAAAEVHDAFFASLQSLCGRAYAGEVEADVPSGPADDAFAGRTLVMHVRDCDEDTVRIPFHVGTDRSRTWVVTRTGEGLRLKHDHRHDDGAPDAVTMYGGDTAGAGTPTRQEFPVDAESVALFQREGLAGSVSNTWALELVPGERFTYELARPGGRLFRVAFDLATPVAEPPPPWGAD